MKDGKDRFDKVDLSQIPSIASLAAFERAATYSSFAKAAVDLGRSPSAISHAVNELEQKYGCILFERVGRTVRLTQAGEEYLESVREALIALDQGRKNITGALESSVIHLHAPPLVTKELIIPRLDRFKKKHPDLEVNLEVNRDPIDWSCNTPDVEIRVGLVESDRQQVYQIGRIGFTPGCHPRLLEGPDGLRRIEDLERFTTIGDNLWMEGWTRWLRAAGRPDVELRNHLRFTDLLAITAAVRNGLGVALYPYPFILNYPGYGKEIVVTFPEIPMDYRHYKLLCRRERKHERKIALFRDWISEEFSELEREGVM